MGMMKSAYIPYYNNKGGSVSYGQNPLILFD